MVSSEASPSLLVSTGRPGGSVLIAPVAPALSLLLGAPSALHLRRYLLVNQLDSLLAEVPDRARVHREPDVEGVHGQRFVGCRMHGRQEVTVVEHRLHERSEER